MWTQIKNIFILAKKDTMLRIIARDQRKNFLKKKKLEKKQNGHDSKNVKKKKSYRSLVLITVTSTRQ